MPDLTAGGVPVYRDSAGVLREAPVSAQTSNPSSDTDQRTLGFHQFTSTDLQEVCWLSAPDGATRAYVQNSGGSAVRYRSDGEDPTMSVGLTLDVGEGQSFWNDDVPRAAFIDTGNNAVLDVQFYG